MASTWSLSSGHSDDAPQFAPTFATYARAIDAARGALEASWPSPTGSVNPLPGRHAPGLRVGPSGADPSTPTGQYFERQQIAPDDLRAFPSDAAALAAVRAGEGIMLALVHAVVDDVRRRATARLDVHGTPYTDLWYATTLGAGRSLPGALALQRFATTPQATRAVTARQHGVPASRVRPFVHVTLWSGVARAAGSGAS
jgi:hypothetical protein